MERRVRTVAVAIVVALGLGFATRTLRVDAWYAYHPAYRAQVDALLDGRVAVATTPDGLAHDFVWSSTGTQQVWGLGVPLWQAPFEAVGRLIGVTPFPDRIAMVAWLSLVIFVLMRAWRARETEPWWIGAGSVVITALLPAVVAMMRGRIDVYDEAALYAYGAAMILLGGLACLVHKPSRARYLLLLAAAGATGLVRPTVWFYGLGTALVATLVYLRHRKDLLAVSIGAVLFVAGGAALYATNSARFGNGTEFGHRLNLASLPGNLMATRFSYPFERVGIVEAAEEELGSLFGRPEAHLANHSFYQKDLHVGQSDAPRWREYYFSTYSWPYLALILAGLVVGLRAWRRHDHTTSWMVWWAILGGGPLAVFYLHSPSMSSRYQLDLAPAIAALLVLAWRAGATWLHDRKRGAIAIALLVAMWTAAVITSKTFRPKIGSEPVTHDEAEVSTYSLSRPDPVQRLLPAAHYDLLDPKLDSYLGVAKTAYYLNGTGWDIKTGAVPPATYLFVEDPKYLEVTVQGDGDVRAAIGLVHLHIASTTVMASARRIRFEADDPNALPTGLVVAFLAFGSDEHLDDKLSGMILRDVRWRD